MQSGHVKASLIQISYICAIWTWKSSHLDNPTYAKYRHIFSLFRKPEKPKQAYNFPFYNVNGNLWTCVSQEPVRLRINYPINMRRGENAFDHLSFFASVFFLVWENSQKCNSTTTVTHRGRNRFANIRIYADVAFIYCSFQEFDIIFLNGLTSSKLSGPKLIKIPVFCTFFLVQYLVSTFSWISWSFTCN